MESKDKVVERYSENLCARAVERVIVNADEHTCIYLITESQTG
jgi:hypothetical protein